MSKYAEHVAAVLATAPKPTPDMLDVISHNLYSDRPKGPPPEPAWKSELRLLQERRDKLDRKFRKALTSCAYCDLPEVAHRMQASRGMGFHQHVPLDPDGVMKIAAAYQPELAEADTAIANLKERHS